MIWIWIGSGSGSGWTLSRFADFLSFLISVESTPLVTASELPGPPPDVSAVEPPIQARNFR